MGQAKGVETTLLSYAGAWQAGRLAVRAVGLVARGGQSYRLPLWYQWELPTWGALFRQKIRLKGHYGPHLGKDSHHFQLHFQEPF